MLVIAFLGMGKMGRPMAYNLASAGFRVRCWNRTPEKLKGLQKTIQKLKDKIREKDNFISQYEKIMLELDKEFKKENATFLASTNLKNKL